MVNALDAASQPIDPVAGSGRRCVFCDEDIRPGASVCPHCRNALAPFQGIADRNAALEQKVAALEQDLATLRAAADERDLAVTGVPAAQRPVVMWPHMVDNLFLGLTALLAGHWLATTLPMENRTVFRLVALCVAIPFGYRFEKNALAGTAGQVVAALGFGSIGTLAIAVLDLAVAGHMPPGLTAQDIIESVAVISLSHFAGSALVHTRRARAERAVASRHAAQSLLHIEPARLKSTAELVKLLYDAAAPLVAGGAALWAAFGHNLF